MAWKDRKSSPPSLGTPMAPITPKLSKANRIESVWAYSTFPSQDQAAPISPLRNEPYRSLPPPKKLRTDPTQVTQDYKESLWRPNFASDRQQLNLFDVSASYHHPQASHHRSLGSFTNSGSNRELISTATSSSSKGPGICATRLYSSTDRPDTASSATSMAPQASFAEHKKASKASLRPNKTGFTRSRTGCFTCRNQKKKCDEKRPQCTRCANNLHKCQYPSQRVSSGSNRHSEAEYSLLGAELPLICAESGIPEAQTGNHLDPRSRLQLSTPRSEMAVNSCHALYTSDPIYTTHRASDHQRSRTTTQTGDVVEAHHTRHFRADSLENYRFGTLEPFQGNLAGRLVSDHGHPFRQEGRGSDADSEVPEHRMTFSGQSTNRNLEPVHTWSSQSGHPLRAVPYAFHDGGGQTRSPEIGTSEEMAPGKPTVGSHRDQDVQETSIAEERSTSKTERSLSFDKHSFYGDSSGSPSSSGIDQSTCSEPDVAEGHQRKIPLASRSRQVQKEFSASDPTVEQRSGMSQNGNVEDSGPGQTSLRRYKPDTCFVEKASGSDLVAGQLGICTSDRPQLSEGSSSPYCPVSIDATKRPNFSNHDRSVLKQDNLTSVNYSKSTHALQGREGIESFSRGASFNPPYSSNVRMFKEQSVSVPETMGFATNPLLGNGPMTAHLTDLQNAFIGMEEFFGNYSDLPHHGVSNCFPEDHCCQDNPFFESLPMPPEFPADVETWFLPGNEWPKDFLPDLLPGDSTFDFALTKDGRPLRSANTALRHQGSNISQGNFVEVCGQDGVKIPRKEVIDESVEQFLRKKLSDETSQVSRHGPMPKNCCDSESCESTSPIIGNSVQLHDTDTEARLLSYFVDFVSATIVLKDIESSPSRTFYKRLAHLAASSTGGPLFHAILSISAIHRYNLESSPWWTNTKGSPAPPCDPQSTMQPDGEEIKKTSKKMEKLSGNQLARAHRERAIKLLTKAQSRKGMESDLPIEMGPAVLLLVTLSALLEGETLLIPQYLKNCEQQLLHAIKKDSNPTAEARKSGSDEDASPIDKAKEEKKDDSFSHSEILALCTSLFTVYKTVHCLYTGECFPKSRLESLQPHPRREEWNKTRNNCTIMTLGLVS
ncbi:hypothetical protein IE53DRAFT_214038 [Violaceomyces palustris]|uniref:Uncharacterized protein n=1 Tax=Violaceomyces palustris TaxID=1673888 RepID=A0ACD0NQI1_9BASI|nr:hypothetical protein IE53DRAFT_214038 [Violaceomyces palustris]